MGLRSFRLDRFPDSAVILTDRIPEDLSPNKWTDLQVRRFLPLLYPNFGEMITQVEFDSPRLRLYLTGPNLQELYKTAQDLIQTAPELKWVYAEKQNDKIQIQMNPGAESSLAWIKSIPLKNTENAGDYVVAKKTKEEMILIPNPDRARNELVPLHFVVSKDEMSQIFRLLRNEADLAFNTLSISKTRWMQKHFSDRFFSQEFPGFHLSIIGMTARSPLLQENTFRRELAARLDSKGWVAAKGFGYLSDPVPEFNFLSAPETELNFDTWLNKHFPVQPNHYRATLQFVTTLQREGSEIAQWLKSVLNSMQIDLKILSLEPVLMTRTLKEGKTDFFTTRFLRASNDDTLYQHIAKKGGRNFYGRSIDQPGSLPQMKNWIETEVPFVPLWSWNHGLILNRQWSLPANLKVDDDYAFLRHLRKSP